MSILMYKQRHRPVNYRKTPKCNYAHIGYIATRPGAVKNEGMRHGLFGKMLPGDVVDFEKWQEAGRIVRELSYRHVNMYRSIVSFAPDTAKELGLIDQKAWKDYVEHHVVTMARLNGIRIENLSWVAAYHNEQSHPHCHVMFWDRNQKVAVNYVNPEIPNQIRIKLIKDTFADKIQEYYAQKDAARALVGEITGEMVNEFDEYIRTLRPKEYARMRELCGRIDDGEMGTTPAGDVLGRMDLGPFAARLFALKDIMPETGRIIYKLLPDEVKDEVNAFVEDLKSGNEYINSLVEDFVDSNQSIKQLEAKYEKETASIIMSNCENWVYLQADDSETLDEISNKLGTYTTSSYQLSSSHGRYTTPSSSHSVNLMERKLLNADEVKRIKRPYQIVTGREHPALMYAPDLSEWMFNKMLGLGDLEHNRKLREERDRKRPMITDVSLEPELWGMDQISMAIVSLLRVGAAARFIYCMIRLTAAEEEAGRYKKRARNTVVFYIIGELIWQIKDIVFYYYK